MSASARLRQSLEPLAAPLLGIGLLHVLVGFVILSILPELRKKQNAKSKIGMAWLAPSDFLLDKTIKLETPAAPAIPTPQVVTAPVQTMPAAPALAAPAPQPPVTLAAEKSLADALQTNRGLLPPSTEAGLMSLTPMPLTINTVAPSPATLPTTAAPTPVPVPPVMPEKPAAVQDALPSAVATTAANSGNLKEANKYITLSAILPPGKAPEKPRANKPVLNLLDIANLNANERAEDSEAGGADMGPVEKALQVAILKEWTAPPATSVPPSQRRATMEISISRDGTISDASMKTASGSGLLDDSIRQAADRLKKIPVTLPSNFPKERYELRVNFQIE
jgi:TonB C terminal